MEVLSERDARGHFRNRYWVCHSSGDAKETPYTWIHNAHAHRDALHDKDEWYVVDHGRNVIDNSGNLITTEQQLLSNAQVCTVCGNKFLDVQAHRTKLHPLVA